LSKFYGADWLCLSLFRLTNPIFLFIVPGIMWLHHPIHLSGTRVRLEPLNESHIPDLVALGSDPTIWTHLPFDGSNAAKLTRELGIALVNRVQGSQYPFAILEQESNRIIGSTRLFDIFPEHKKLEIGWTWYAKDAWGKGFNTECKLLLLRYCFETLQANRVQLKTRKTNLRSQAAILKIGASYEGLLRNDRVMPDGSIRDTMVYSIILEEWPKVESLLYALLDQLPAKPI